MNNKNLKWVLTRLWRYRIKFEKKKSKFSFLNPLIYKLTENLNKKDK